jgi:hypothetical protein
MSSLGGVAGFEVDSCGGSWARAWGAAKGRKSAASIGIVRLNRIYVPEVSL